MRFFIILFNVFAMQTHPYFSLAFSNQSLSDCQVKMIQNRQPYVQIFKIFKFLGFWDDDEISTRHRRFAIASYGNCFIYCLAIAMSTLQNHELSNILDATKFVLLGLVNIYSIFAFVTKKSTLCELLDTIDQIELENPDVTPYIDRACVLIHRIFCMIVASLIVIYLVYISSPLQLHQLHPMYVPELIKDYKLTFYCFWLYQNFNGAYTIIAYVPIHEFRCSLMIMLNHILQYLGDKLENLTAEKDNYEDAKNELGKCVKLHINILR